MTRQSTIFFASLTAALMFGASAVPASASGAHYQAQPVAPPSESQLVVRDLIWKCGAGGCTTGKSNSRPLVDCSALVKSLGAVRNFAVDGRELSPAELEKCNARAR